MPDSWLEISIDTPPEYVEPLSEIFRRYGEGGIAVELPGGFSPDEGESPPVPERVTVKTYLPVDNTTDQRRAQIDIGARLVAHLAPISQIREQLVSEQDWMTKWQEFFHILKVGKRMTVCPAWLEHTPEPCEIVIRMDPGMAFGTGHHPTTRMCMEMIERRISEGDRVLDVGAGSAILSIAAVGLGAESATGFEIDAAAARSGRNNIEINGLQNSIEMVHGTLPSPKAPPQRFDLVVANISAKVVIDMAEHLVSCVAPGGALLASGILEQRLGEVASAIESAGARIDEHCVDGDWVALLASP